MSDCYVWHVCHSVCLSRGMATWRQVTLKKILKMHILQLGQQLTASFCCFDYFIDSFLLLRWFHGELILIICLQNVINM